MVGEADEGVDPHFVPRRSSSQDAHEDLTQSRRGFQQEATLEGSRGDLDQRPVREVAEAATHLSADDIGLQNLAATGSRRLPDPGAWP